MRTEELMRGDLLFYKGKFNAFPFKVEQITKKKIGYHVHPNENRMYYLHPSEVFPIPLTNEFLTRNGFLRDGSITYMGETLEAFVLSTTPTLIGYLSKEGWLEIDYHGEYPFCKVTGVHEFQHLLRLLKINKEIEL